MNRPHSAKMLPAIAPDHLRDHVDDPRIGQVWERLERNLPPAGSRRPPARDLRRPAWLCAAAVVGFLVGLSVDRLASLPSREGPSPAALTPASDTGGREVFAAGTTQRNYWLPGGGFLSLAPGTIVDTVTSDARGLTLRLIRGEASLGTEAEGAAARTTPLAMWVGEAQVSTRAGNVRVRRSGETAELEVLRGSADVASPDSELGTRQTTLGVHQKITVPIRIATARTTPQNRTQPSQALPNAEPEAASETAAESPVASPPANWRDRCAEGDWPGVLQLLKEQTGGGQAAVAAAASAADLMCIHDAYRSRGGDLAVAQRALERVVLEFPNTQHHGFALWYLAEMHARAGQLDRARTHLENLSRTPGAALADDALCKLIQAAAERGETEVLQRHVQQYRTQYPDGACNKDIDRLLAELAAKPKGPDGATPDEPDEEGESTDEAEPGGAEPDDGSRTPGTSKPADQPSARPRTGEPAAGQPDE